jgi:hypothetical protein
MTFKAAPDPLGGSGGSGGSSIAGEDDADASQPLWVSPTRKRTVGLAPGTSTSSSKPASPRVP